MKYIIILLLLSSPVLSASFTHIYNNYTPEREFAYCAKTSTWQTDTGFDFKLRGYSFAAWGSRTSVKFRCNYAYRTLIHSHGSKGYCIASEVDYKEFEKKRWRTSIIICQDRIRVMTKIRGEILEKVILR